MTKFCVKKPFFVVVAVIIVLIIGGVSLGKMQTDLLPDMEVPYMMVITTEPGASPEEIESNVSEPIESALGVISGVENIVSTSAENYSMVMLEFADGTDMNSALVRVSKAVDGLELPDECGKPNTMEVSMDMMATMYASVDYKGKNIEDLSAFTKKVVEPYLERQEGVASIYSSGSVENTVEVRLNEDKINNINDKILSQTNDKLDDAAKKIEKAQKKLDSAKSSLSGKKSDLKEKQDKTNNDLAQASMKLDEAKATKAAYESSLNSLKASQSALNAEKKAYKDAKVEDSYKALDGAFTNFNSTLKDAAKQSGIEIPENVKDAVEDKDKLEKFTEWMNQLGYGEQVKSLKYSTLKQVYNVAEVRLPQIDTALANLKTEIKAAEMVVKTMSQKMKDIDEGYVKAVAGGYSSASAFGSADAQMAAGEEKIKNAESDLKDAKDKLDKSKKAAIENSNLDALLSLDTLSAMISAQNFSMPAGYIDDKEDNQWLVKIGQNYTSEKELQSMVLTKIKGVGKIKLSDVADITVINNAGDSYAKVNGESAILLSIYKSSTASTSTVSKNIEKAFDELEKKYDGVSLTPMMNQGDYIEVIINSILNSILLGAILAIIVLALFLKDVKPTLVVAFSIPFSVLFAIIIMYFTNITLNAMSLAGLCLGIGMLVDNSIVVMENIYRLRNRGLSVGRAAVQGAKQVAGPIVASTITTICVFLPMVYTTGTISQLLIPFAFTISYALIASLLVALTVVPTMASVMLKNTKEHNHKWFDAVKELYGKALAFCLRFKILPLGIAIVLFVFAVFETFNTGLVMMDGMESNQISVNLTLDKDTDKENAYKTADEVMEAITKVKGIAKVGAMDGNASATSGALGSGTTDNYTSFYFSVLTNDDIKTTKQFRKIREEIEKNTKNIKCKELTVASSAMGGMSSMMSGGLEVKIYGTDQNKLIDISKDVMDMMKDIKGSENVSNGIDEKDKQVHLVIDKDKAAAKGLTVAQIYQDLAKQISTDKRVMTISMNDSDVDVKIVDETDKVTYENLMDREITATTKNGNGEDVTKKYKLSEFAKENIEDTVEKITRDNQTRYMSVTADIKDGYNATLMSRKLNKKIKEYKVPEGYTIEIAGESDQVMDMVWQMIQAIALGFVLIYLVMVAQFQSMLSPFIILFTVPLAFTGGMIGLLIFGQQISAMALMGFMILMGTVVNNGIVFVDYVNNLRLQGLDKHTALIATGKTRMRPILMTAMTTILSMCVMVFSQDAGNAMQKGMAIVVAAGLVYSTLMTLFIVPVMYDILYRRKPKNIDVGDGDMDQVPDEAEEFLEEMRLND